MQDLNLLEAINDESSSKIVIDGLAATTTSISDELSEHFKKIARNDNVFRKFRIELARIMDKNSKALQDSVLGLQLLINKNDEDNILKILEITAEEIRLAYDNSPCYQKFGKDLLKKNQLLFLIPLVLYATELARLKKEKEAKLVYFSMFLKPYASRVSVIFPYGIKYEQMQYVTEYVLNDKFDIKKLGNVAAVLQKLAYGSYDNYMPRLLSNPTDYLIYIVYDSGVKARISSTLKSVAEKYYANNGKYLGFELNSAISSDEESEGNSFSIEIESNAAVKADITRRAVMKISESKLDDAYIKQAVAIGWKLTSPTESYITVTKSALKEIIDKRRKDLPVLFDAILGTFLYNSDKSTTRRTKRDIKSVTFILNANAVYKASNTNDKNITTVKTLIKDFLTECSVDYITYKSDSSKRALEKSILLYFTIFLQKVA